MLIWPISLNANDLSFESVKVFEYLEVIFMKDNKEEVWINIKMSKAWKTGKVSKYKWALKSKIKYLLIYNNFSTLQVPETWVPPKTVWKQLNVLKNKIQKQYLDQSKPKRRTMKNRKRTNFYMNPFIVTMANSSRVRWIGHSEEEIGNCNNQDTQDDQKVGFVNKLEKNS